MVIQASDRRQGLVWAHKKLSLWLLACSTAATQLPLGTHTGVGVGDGPEIGGVQKYTATGAGLEPIHRRGGQSVRSRLASCTYKVLDT